MKKYQSFLSENFQFLEVKFSIYLNRRVFVMSVLAFIFVLEQTPLRRGWCAGKQNKEA